MIPMIARRAELTEFCCARCAYRGFALTETVLDADQFDLPRFAMPPQRPQLELGCPDCADTLEPHALTVCFWPPEEELAALAWRADWAEDGIGDQEWFLLDCAATGDVARLAPAVLDPALRLPLENVDEGLLVQTWGRPLSLRQLIRQRIVEVTASGEPFIHGPAGPGLYLAAMDLPPAGDPVATARLRGLEIAHAIPFNDACTCLLSDHADEAARWLGSLTGGLGATYSIFLVYSAAVLQDELRRAARTSGQQLTLTSDETGDPVLVHDELPVPIHLAELAATAGSAGLRASEAARRRLLGASIEAAAAQEALTVIADFFSPEEIEVHSIEEVSLKRASDDRKIRMNLARQLPKFGWDASSHAFREHITRMRAMLDAPNDAYGSCPCPKHWQLTQLRDTSYLANPGDLHVRRVYDLHGREFAALAGDECAHVVRSLSATEAGEPFREETSKATYPIVAEHVRDVCGDTVGALLTGPNAATILLHDQLSARLARKLAPTLRSTSFDVYALTTNCLLIAPSSEDAQDALDDLRTRTLGSGYPDGEPLGYRGRITTTGTGTGNITLTWTTQTTDPLSAPPMTQPCI